MHPIVALHNESGVIQITQVDNGTHGEDGTIEPVSGLTIHRIYDLEGTSNIGEYMQRYIWSVVTDWWELVPKKPNAFAYWDGTLNPPAWNWDRAVFLNEVRLIRTSKLYASDWASLPDTPLSVEKRQEFLTYRQQLRDYTQAITGDEPSLDDLVWPDEPIT